jgi:hypothetical protein
VSQYATYSTDSSDNPGPLLFLPGSAARAATIERLLTTGRWAALYLKIDNWPAEPTLSWMAEYRHTRILRILIPLGQSPLEPPS